MTTITALPAAPARTMDAPTFVTTADTFIAALPPMVAQINTVAGEINTSASAAANSAAAASTSASSASSSLAAANITLSVVQQTANASVWVSGKVYLQYDSAISPINYQTYRRKIAGSSTVDPSSDGATWEVLNAFPVWTKISSTSYSASAYDHLQVDTTLNSITIIMPNTGLVPGKTFVKLFDYARNFSTNAVTINGNGNKVEGLSENMDITTKGFSGKLLYVDSTKGWMVV